MALEMRKALGDEIFLIKALNRLHFNRVAASLGLRRLKPAATVNVGCALRTDWALRTNSLVNDRVGTAQQFCQRWFPVKKIVLATLSLLILVVGSRCPLCLCGKALLLLKTEN